MSQPIELTKSDINRFFHLTVENDSGRYYSIGRIITFGPVYVFYLDSISRRDWMINKEEFCKNAVRIEPYMGYLMKETTHVQP